MNNPNTVSRKGVFEGFFIDETEKAYFINILPDRVDIWIPRSWIKEKTKTGQHVLDHPIHRFKSHYWAIPRIKNKISSKLSKNMRTSVNRTFSSFAPVYKSMDDELSRPIEERRLESINKVIKTKSQKCNFCGKDFEHYIGYEYGISCSLDCQKEYRKSLM